MYLKKIKIKNFRLLQDVELLLEKRTTLIIGRNNSGKTSIIEIFRSLSTNESLKFKLVDFSLPIHTCFWESFKLKHEKKEDDEIREKIPCIEIRLTIEYEKDDTNLGPLSDFIIDLNPECTEALIVIRFQLKDGEIKKFFNGFEFKSDEDEKRQKKKLLKMIYNEKRIENHYETVFFAEDPNDKENQKSVERSKFNSFLKSSFIFAHRGLKDITHRDVNSLGGIIEKLLKASSKEKEDSKSKKASQKLDIAVEKMEVDINKNFKESLKNILPTFKDFGYPRLGNHILKTETVLDSSKLMEKHTKVRYKGGNGINLPESYSGLGVRNLIHILLKLYEFSRSLNTEQNPPRVCLIFIEEPEVHLHPQMQEVFILKLNDFIGFFGEKFSESVQYIVTTHSSHISNAASFNSMRYFLPKHQGGEMGYCVTEIKDLNCGLDGTQPVDREFLHKYMTLTRCDLLFADKAILIEGMSERLMLPEMIKKIDSSQSKKEYELSSQYISVIEIGGAYWQIFHKLLQFLELNTLIITDIDSVKGNGKKKKCSVSIGTHTSNSGLKYWFDNKDITPDELIYKQSEEKIRDNLCLAYQIPEAEGEPCGRSFEDAFILANINLFFDEEISKDEKEQVVYDKAKEFNNKKSDFALKYAIKETEWEVPKYIAEGLQWLAKKNIHNDFL